MTPPTGATSPARPGGRTLVLVAVLAAAALAQSAASLPLPAEVPIALGIFLFLVAPGLLLREVLFPERRLPVEETLPVAIALSVGVWAAPGLIIYSLELPLGAATAVELAIVAALFVAAAGRAILFPVAPAADPKLDPAPGGRPAVILVLLALAALALWTGAFRAPMIDWDYYNYISHVNKLMSWGKASLQHFAYRDAPPDPIHSYNVWALQWAMIGSFFRVGAIPLYLQSGFIMIPAGAAAFYALFRRLLPPRPALIGFFLFVAYNVFYGGLIFLGSDTFFPDDSQRMIVFPACLALFLLYLERPARGLLAALALAVLGMSVVHVFWGLCFYLSVGAYALGLMLSRAGAGAALLAAMRSGGRWLAGAALLLLLAPFGLALGKSAAMFLAGDTRGIEPLMNFSLAGPAAEGWIYFLVAVALPLAALFLLTRSRWRKGGDDEASRQLLRRAAAVIVVAGLLALPYAWLRSRAIEVTNWSLFGRNPYRAFITPNVFILNPFKWSLGNPEMTFFPLFIPGYLLLPLLWRRARREFPARLALAILILVPIVCFHPIVATLFTKYFSLGYLRRMLRLLAPFSLLPTALALDWLIAAAAKKFAALRRPAVAGAAGLAAAVAISAACIPFAGSPEYYDRMFDKMIRVARATPRGELPDDHRPFAAITAGGWFASDAVLFADIWTSYRLTAYLPQYVAAQAKPGTGIADQDQRRFREMEFFAAATPVERMARILDRCGAAGVIVNRNSAYNLLGLPMGHPEAIGKLKSDPARFELLSDEGDWAIFRYRALE